jgi:hypothetical protein
VVHSLKTRSWYLNGKMHSASFWSPWLLVRWQIGPFFKSENVEMIGKQNNYPNWQLLLQTLIYLQLYPLKVFNLGHT